MTYLCVPIFVHSLEQAQRDAALAAEHGADLIELRIDTFTDADQVAALLKLVRLPCVVTCRMAAEGGQCDLPGEQRLALLQSAAKSGAQTIDVELQTLSAHPDAASMIPARLIVSAHDFVGRPDRLYNLIAEMNSGAGAVNKLAWTARTVRDNLEAFEILQQRIKPTIALCMGEAGVLSRILARKFDAFLTFASLSSDSGTAPGQVAIADMKNLYRWDAQGPRTRVYGVVGSPVAHSMSPAIHNAAFAAVGHDGVYVPLLVNPGYESFKAFMESFLEFSPLDLSGLSVTIPHKENALRYLLEKGGEVDDLARRIGALNTIVIEQPSEVDGAAGAVKLRGFSTDYSAILDAITDALSITRPQLSQYRVAVIGAGGTGRTAVAALAHCGATVIVYNRTKERAEELAVEFDGKSGKVVAAPLEKLCDSCCQIYLNTTSLGMHPNVHASPFDPESPKLGPQTLVFDSVYNPIETRLIAQARASGARTVNGVEMFVRQAAGQFEAWTHKPAPTDLMRSVIEKRLAPARST